MSATIPDNKQLDDLLKSTGFDCPENLKDKTFYEVTSGSGESSRTPQELNITANGNYNTPDGVYYDPISVNVPLPGITIVDVQTGSISTAGTQVNFTYTYGKSLDPKCVVWIGKEQINTRDLVVGQTYNYTISLRGIIFDITLLKQLSSPGLYRLTVVYKDRNQVVDVLKCFLVVGTLN